MGIFRRRPRSDPFAGHAQAGADQSFSGAAQGPPAPQTSGGRAAGASPAGPVTFSFEVSDVFSITGRGTVATGTVTLGAVHPGDSATLVGAAGTRQVVISAVEAFGGPKKEAGLGDEAGLLLPGVTRDEVRRGDTITGP